MPPHIFEVGLKVNTKVYLDLLKSVVIPWCNQVTGGRHWVWQLDSAPAHKFKETQAWLQKEYYDFVPFSYCSPPPWIWTHMTNSFGHTSSSRRSLWKRHTPSYGSVSRQWLRLKAATLNRYQLYYIIKLAELIFSIKVLK